MCCECINGVNSVYHGCCFSIHCVLKCINGVKTDYHDCCLSIHCVLRGDWPVKFWSQNVPEQVFVFFQVWVPKHAYFSSKSVFLWYMFDFYANENILWTLVCLFLSCGRSFHWKNTPFHPLVTGTFYPKLSTCCLSKCSVASDLQNDVMTQWELPLMKAQMVWKGGKGIPTETS